MNKNYSLITKAQNGDKLSEEALVKENMPLVHSCVRSLLRDNYEYEDLLQLGTIGLIKAVRRFDTAYNTAFSTYAVPLIMGEIRRFQRDDGIIKYSRSYKEIVHKAMLASEELSYEFGREPTISELSNHIGIDTEKLILAMETCRGCDSLDRPISNGESAPRLLGELIPGGENSDDELEKIALKDALSKLNARERTIIMMRYFGGKTQSEVSACIGVSQVQVSRIEKKLLSKLKNYLE